MRTATFLPEMSTGTPAAFEGEVHMYMCTSNMKKGQLNSGGMIIDGNE